MLGCVGTESEGQTLEALIDELGRVLHDDGEARELARRAGFPAADLPAFDTASVFWSRVVRAADDGKTLGGIGAIVEQAKAKFPGNPFFAAYAPVTVTTSTPPEPRSGAAIDNRGASIGQQIVVHGNATFGPMTVSVPASAVPSHDAGNRDARPASESPSALAVAPVEGLRDAYLARLRDFHERRLPLHDVFRGYDVIGPRLSMLAVEQPLCVAAEAKGPGTVAQQTHTLASVLQDRLDKGQRPILTVLGDVGTGKSTLLEQTAQQLAIEAAKSMDAPLPWLVVAADVPSLAQQQLGRYCGLRPEQQLQSAPSVRWVYLVDGYDEIEAGKHGAVDTALRRLLDDQKTQAIVIMSRPVAEPRCSPRADRYRVAPWAPEQGLRLAHAWSEVGGEPLPPEVEREARELLSNPLTATLYIAFANRAGPCPTRAQLFSVLTESLFDTWASQRPTTRSLAWDAIAPVYQSMARLLLQQGRPSFPWADVQRALDACVPNVALRHMKTAEDLGLLLRRPDGTFEFLLRPIAEHLAGASLLDVPPGDLAKIASAAWAEEPVRHCIGLHASRGDGRRARDSLLELARKPTSEIEAVHALRTAIVAARAAADIRQDAEPVAARVAEALLVQVIDGSSTWRPERAEAVARTLVQGGGTMGLALRDGAVRYLEQLADGMAVDYHGPLKGLYHPEGVVRLETMRDLASVFPPEAIGRLLVTMLPDCGTDKDRWSVAAEAALALRKMPRGAAFEELKPWILHHLHSQHQAGAGAAAIVLHPDEHEAHCLVRALRAFSDAYRIPSEVVDDLRRHEAGAAALQENPISPDKLMMSPSTEEIRSQAEPTRTTPSIFTRIHLSRTLGSSLLAYNDSSRADCIARARLGGTTELEALCDLAFDDPGPLITLVEEVIGRHRPGLVERDRPFLHFSENAERSLKLALEVQANLLDAVVGLWARTREGHAPFARYPGRALEALVHRSRPDVTRVYAEWLPTTFNIMSQPCDVPPHLRDIPEVQQAARQMVEAFADHAFEGRPENGQRTYLAPSVAGFLLSHLRPFWANDLVLIERLETWIRGDDKEKMLAGLTAWGPDGLPPFASEIIATQLGAVGQDGDLRDIRLQIELVVFSANIDLPPHSVAHLLEVAAGTHPVRFAAGHAVMERLAPDDASRVSASLTHSWPDDNWGFWYSRHDQVLPSLVRAAPTSWGDRAKEVGAGWHLELAQPLLSLLDSPVRTSILGVAFRSARSQPLPWYLLAGPRPKRLLDAVLELIYDSEIDADTLAGWSAPTQTTEG